MTTNTSPQKSSGPLRWYLLLVCLFSLIGGVISGGIMIYDTAERYAFSDEEYLNGHYRYYSCDSEQGYWDEETDEYVTEERSAEEIAACEVDAKADTLVERNYDYKKDMIATGVWFVIFVILFACHFPFFLRENKKN